MQHPFCNFLRPALIEEVRTEITAGSPADIHCPLIPIAAVRTFPQVFAVLADDSDFAVITTSLTVATVLQALCTQRMGCKVAFACLVPSVVVATFVCRTLFVTVQRLVFLTVSCSIGNECRTAGMLAGGVRTAGHLTSPTANRSCRSDRRRR